MAVVRRVTLACVLLAVLVPVAAASPPRVSDTPSGGGAAFGGDCDTKRTTAAKANCYVKFILADIQASKDASREVPIIEGRAKAAGGFIAGACHGLMHRVGRMYARRHHVTLATLQYYLPRSNDPGCSAGFGHGLMMALGPQIVDAGPKGALRVCMHLATRMRQYGCVHGLGHAYMRLYDDYLQYALPLCRKLGADAAPDCAQGAFHDYWIAASGRDATTNRERVKSPRVLCGVRTGDFVLACWYRVYVERPPSRRIEKASEIDHLCAGLAGVQRSGCVAAAALSAATSDPFQLVRLCSGLHGADIASCLRAVPVEEVGSWWGNQVALIHTCWRLESDARAACYRWFGKTLTVVTNGIFERRCRLLLTSLGRTECRAGADQFRRPLVTFA